jgi:hypothetical protein
MQEEHVMHQILAQIQHNGTGSFCQTLILVIVMNHQIGVGVKIKYPKCFAKLSTNGDVCYGSCIALDTCSCTPGYWK